MTVRLDPLAVSDAAEMAVVLADPGLYADDDGEQRWLAPPS